MTTKSTLWRWDLIITLVIALSSLAISAYTGYAANDRETVQRLTATETHQTDDRKTLDEIKETVRETNAKVTEILIVLGGKH